ncbi:MAG: MBL fold metallo-hydrolase [Nanoarchaeota archaeon]|nr:MBL fold metallo-hydrolase [Nanoarchaeota archaeon]
MNVGNIEITWLGHSGFLIQNSKVIYIDPYQIREGLPKADFILLTHGHYDHCSLLDIEKIVKDGTRIVMTADCQSKITRFKVPIRMEVIEPYHDLDFGTFKLSAMPAYNINKHFHRKEDGLVGYLIKFNDVFIYHAGDSDFIPEMQKLTGYKHKDKKFVALLPVGGRFTMSPEEAFEAAKMIKPDVVIPMHWGSIVGSAEEAEEFKELCDEEGINCEILEKE